MRDERYYVSIKSKNLYPQMPTPQKDRTCSVHALVNLSIIQFHY